ncbi:LysR substrate-binding domain-containing protein [Catellatospora sp. NPDC049133]|jgi:DNA-binding transcriptional LysR family regulator|uniref:LysR family transcriptional regulator n=1 Tax=Catellatospora sp. NPDC049133 TaxID=3155499 RepID=UPI00340CE440
MSMQLQQLKYFVAVADTRHFTQAAEQAGVTQPSLSKQIHVLETELGAPLFTRSRGNIMLTPAGEALLPRARRILADVETARLEVQELIGVRRGRLRLGATPSLCTSLVAPVLRRYQEGYPGVRLMLEEGGSQDLVGKLARGGLDLALIVLPDQGTDPALRAEPILRESLVVASSATLPPPTEAGALSLSELDGQPLVMFRPGYDLRDATLEACRRAGFTPTFAIEGGEMDAVLGFVEAGLGVALVPSLVLSGRTRLRSTPLAPPGVQRTIALAHRRDVTPTHAARALREVLLAYVHEESAWSRLPVGVEPI